MVAAHLTPSENPSPLGFEGPAASARAEAGTRYTASITVPLDVDTASGAIPVVLTDGEHASGLADMLRQFIEQTLAASPRKARQARRLTGRAVFRSAEDEQVCVCLTFAGDHIELRDTSTPQPRDPWITADFLTVAHLTSGRENPFRLLAQRRLTVRFSVLQVPFLLRVFSFLRIESAPRRAIRAGWILATAAAAGTAVWAAYWYITAQP
jgi:predicted lipid carrier protein YhbT